MSPHPANLISPRCPNAQATLDKGWPQPSIRTAPRLHPVHLNFESLSLYEPVQHQYGASGVRFDGAIAIIPSNPAFSTQPGAIALMPTARRSHLAIYFQVPCRQVEVLLVGARQVRVVAYTLDHQVLLRQCTPVPRSTPSDLEAHSWPQQAISLDRDDIAEVVIASDAPFVLNHLAYS